MNKLTPADICFKISQHWEIGVNHKQIYLQEQNNWKRISDDEFAIRIRSLYPKEEQRGISTACIQETIARLRQDPALQLKFLECTMDKYVKLNNSTFNVETGENIVEPIGDFGYTLNFDYIKPEERDYPHFLSFANSVFPEETEKKIQLLLEMIGYCLSDYQVAKAAFFLLGESNSGKSTILELIVKLFPEHAITTLPLYRLENRFNLAKLADSKLNICFELSQNSFSSCDIFKMITSNELVTAEHKGQTPFEFRIRCKSLNAGNIIPDIKENMGFSAILNRLVILLFPVSIPKEKQDLSLLEKLWDEKDSIFSEALDKLVELKNRNFQFTEPSDSIKFKTRLDKQGNVIKYFLNERCVYDNNERVHLTTLYDALKHYCDENLLDMKVGKAQFSQELCKKFGVEHCKFRMNGGPPLAGVKGIRLKKSEEYNRQDSQMYSQLAPGKLYFRNAGTLERKENTNNE